MEMNGLNIELSMMAEDDMARTQFSMEQVQQVLKLGRERRVTSREGVFEARLPMGDRHMGVLFLRENDGKILIAKVYWTGATDRFPQPSFDRESKA